MLRIRFQANPDDPRPIKFPLPHPYWITGYAGDGSHAIVVAYADSEKYITDNWPEAENLDSQEVTEYVFTSRFPKPEWFKL